MSPNRLEWHTTLPHIFFISKPQCNDEFLFYETDLRFENKLLDIFFSLAFYLLLKETIDCQTQASKFQSPRYYTQQQSILRSSKIIRYEELKQDIR